MIEMSCPPCGLMAIIEMLTLEDAKLWTSVGVGGEGSPSLMTIKCLSAAFALLQPGEAELHGGSEIRHVSPAPLY